MPPQFLISCFLISLLKQTCCLHQISTEITPETFIAKCNISSLSSCLLCFLLHLTGSHLSEALPMTFIQKHLSKFFSCFLGFLIISMIFSENSGNRDSSSFIFKVQCLAQYLVPGGCNYPFSSQFSVLGHEMQLIFSFSEGHCPICLGKVTAYPAPGIDNDLFNQIM